MLSNKYLDDKMAAVRDSICGLGQFQIPRPKCIGMEFITVRGTHTGFYRSINKNIALKYGLLQQRNYGVSTSRRPSIPEQWTNKNNSDEERRKNNNGSIPEEPEVVSEPLPDYEIDGEGKKEVKTSNVAMNMRYVNVLNDFSTVNTCSFQTPIFVL